MPLSQLISWFFTPTPQQPSKEDSPPLRIAVMGSTNGTSTELLFQKGMVHYVVSDHEAAGILVKAANAEIPYKYIQGRHKASGRKREDFEREVTTLFNTQKIDLIILIGFMSILTDKFVARWRGRLLNVHPSLLPEFSGGMDKDVHRAVIKAQKQKTGCTVHFVTALVDAGPQAIQCEHLLTAEQKLSATQLQQYNSESLLDLAANSLKKSVQELEKTALVIAAEAFRNNPRLFDDLLTGKAKTIIVPATNQSKHTTWLPSWANWKCPEISDATWRRIVTGSALTVGMVAGAYCVTKAYRPRLTG